MAEDGETQPWWAVCKPLLTSVVSLPPGEVLGTNQGGFSF